MPGEFRVMRNAALLVGVVALAVLSLSTTDAGTVTVTLDVTLGQHGFSSCMSELQRQAALTTTKPAIEKRVVLGQQKAKPDNWAHLIVKGAGGMQATLAIRLDNLYLVGFKTSSAWYAFKGDDRLIAGATALSFAGDYKSLTGGSHQTLKTVAVGRKAAADALSTLATFRHGTTPDEETKKALVTFVLMVCEGQRFTLIRSEVMQAWDQGGHVGEKAVELTVNWKEVSCALLQWNKSKKWDSSYSKEIEKLGDPVMKTAEAAAANIFLILQVVACL